MTPGISILERLSAHLTHNLSKLSNVGFVLAMLTIKVGKREAREKHFNQIIHPSLP